MTRPRIPGILFAWLPALLGASTSATAQEDPPYVPCRSCESRGEKECRRHGKAILELEAAVLQCSDAAACKSCGGALTVDCRSCRNEHVERALEERRRRAAEWLAGRREAVDELLSREIMHLKTEHSDLAFSIRPLTVGRRKLDTHELMHLYGERIEALHADFREVFGIPDRDLPARVEVYMFRHMQDHTTIGPRVAGGGGRSTGQKLMGIDSIYSMYHDLRTMPDDEALHRNIVHNVAHLLLANMTPQAWIGNRKHGWVDAGVAHWFEDRVTGKCANYCYEEVALNIGAGFKGGRWRVPVRKLVESGETRSFAELSGLNTDQLQFEDHALAFAYVDFLIQSRGGKTFAGMVRSLKEGTELREALQKAYGWNPLTIEEPFREWVRANYPLQD